MGLLAVACNSTKSAGQSFLDVKIELTQGGWGFEKEREKIGRRGSGLPLSYSMNSLAEKFCSKTEAEEKY